MRATVIVTALILVTSVGCQSGPEANQRRLERQLHSLERQLQGLTNYQRLSAGERQRRVEQLSREIRRLLDTLAKSAEAEIKAEVDAAGRK